MKMKYIFSLLLIAFLISSCSDDKKQSVEALIETGSLEELRAKKNELSQQQSEIKKQITLLETKISTLDDTKHVTFVTVIKLKDTIFKHYTEIQGDVETDQNIVLYPEYSGVLSRIYVKEGQNVSKGQMLAKIDDGGLSNQVAQIKTQMDLAKTTFERQTRLWEQKIGSEIQYLQSKTTYESSVSAYKQVQSQLNKTIIKAPFNGTVDQIITDQGSIVNPGQNALMRIVNLNNMYIKADVPESYLGKISKGSEILVAFPSIGKTYQGKIQQVSNYINPNNRSFSIKIEIPNKDGALKPNLIATVKVNDYTSKNCILIPNSSVQKNGNNESLVFIYEPKTDTNGTVKQISIKTGKEQNGMIEVLEGLKPNDIILNEGARTLRNGQEVNIKTTSHE